VCLGVDRDRIPGFTAAPDMIILALKLTEKRWCDHVRAEDLSAAIHFYCSGTPYLLCLCGFDGAGT
jgi:hypothetical protein